MSRDLNIPDCINGQSRQDIMRKNLLDIKDAFDHVGLDFWPIQGTLLGLYRDGDVIPYDNDVDVAIRKEDFHKIDNAITELQGKGLEYIYGSWAGTPKHVAFKRNEVTVDVFLFELRDDRRANRHITQIADSAFEIYNELEYQGRQFRIFYNPEKWLSYFYGYWEKPVEGYHAFPQKIG